MSNHLPIEQMRVELRRTQHDFLEVLNAADARALHHRAADGVWSLGEVLAHVSNAREFFGPEAARGAAAAVRPMEMTTPRLSESGRGVGASGGASGQTSPSTVTTVGPSGLYADPGAKPGPGKPAIIRVKIDPEAITPTTTLSALREKAMAARGG